MGIRTAAAAFACAGMATVGMAAPAVADSNGATVVSQSGCNDLGWLKVCGTVQEEYNTTQTPSGDTSLEGDGRFDYTVTFTDGFSFSQTGYYHDHQLLKQGQQQEFSDHLSQTSSVPGWGSCTYSADLHYADGQWQLQNQNYVCS